MSLTSTSVFAFELWRLLRTLIMNWILALSTFVLSLNTSLIELWLKVRTSFLPSSICVSSFAGLILTPINDDLTYRSVFNHPRRQTLYRVSPSPNTDSASDRHRRLLTFVHHSFLNCTMITDIIYDLPRRPSHQLFLQISSFDWIRVRHRQRISHLRWKDSFL